MFRLKRNVVGIECFAQGSRHGKFCGRRTQQLSREDEGKSSSVIPDSRDLMMPSALSNSSDSSSRDFSFIQSSIPGVPGNPMSSTLLDAVFTRCVVTVTGESRIISCRGRV